MLHLQGSRGDQGDPVVLEFPHGQQHHHFHFHFLRCNWKVPVVQEDPEVPSSHPGHSQKIPGVVSDPSSSVVHFQSLHSVLLVSACVVQLNSAERKIECDLAVRSAALTTNDFSGTGRRYFIFTLFRMQSRKRALSFF